jgi:transposase
MPKKGQKFKSYSQTFKLKAVKMNLEQGIGKETTAKILGLSSKSYIDRWVKNYKNYGEEGLLEKRGKSKTFKRGRPRKKKNNLEIENIKLKAENDYLKEILKLKLENIKKKKNME